MNREERRTGAEPVSTYAEVSLAGGWLLEVRDTVHRVRMPGVNRAALLAVASALAGHARGPGLVSAPSRRCLVQTTGLREDWVRWAVEELTAGGWLVWAGRRPGHPNGYRLTLSDYGADLAEREEGA